MKNIPYTIITMLICVFAWGSVFPIAKVVLTDMSGLSLAIWRFAIAVLSLWLYMKLRQQRLPSLSVWQYLILAIVGILGIGGFNLALFSGLQQTSATNGALIMALSPIITSLLAALVSRSFINKKQGFSLIVALSGVILVITNGSIDRLLQLNFNHGDLTVACGMLAWSAYTVCSQRLAHWLPSIEYSFFTMAAGGLSLCLFGLLQNNIHPWQELLSLSWLSLTGVLYIGLFATVIGYLFWVNGIKALGSARASLFFNLVPVFAALVSMILGQSITGIQLTGMFIVLIGLTAPFFVARLVQIPGK